MPRSRYDAQTGPPPRVLVAAELLAADVVQLPEAAAHHVMHVLRLRPGQALQLFDGTGRQAEAHLVGPRGQVRVRAPSRQAETGPDALVACALPKGDRADWLVEKVTEIGVRRLVWLTCARSVTPASPGKMARWQRVASAAARQAGRCELPTIEAPVDLRSWLARRTARQRLVLAPQAPPMGRLVPASGSHGWELLVGPEGGLTPEELRAAEQAGYTAASLGPFVLRVETAAVAGAATLLAMLREPG